jgi:hypothetical protein
LICHVGFVSAVWKSFEQIWQLGNST